MTTFDAEWRGRFERFARTYEDDVRISGWSEAGLERRLRAFRSLLGGMDLPSPSLSLDLGCGAGTYVRLLAGLGHRAIGLDYSIPSLGRALAADPGPKGRYAAGAAYALPFRPNTFGLVLSIGVLQALEYPERALDEMARVLRPEGVLVVEALNGRALVTRARRSAEALRRRPARVRTYAPAELRRWLSHCGLALLRQEGILLPPRTLPGLAWLLDLGPVTRAARNSRGFSEAIAHTFLYVARKTPGAPRGIA